MLTWLTNLEFADPLWLWALLILPVTAVIKIVRWNKQSGVMTYSNVSGAGGFSWAQLRPHLFWLGWAAMGCWIIAFARPHTRDVNAERKGMDGIDIVLATDISASMLAKDLKPSRLDALKKVADEFIDNRESDRIGLVAYAGEAFTATPLTTDYEVVKSALNDLNYDLLKGGTAIGTGLATAVNRLKDSEAKSKVIILMTDGENNAGNISPTAATQMARETGIRVYTIGLGTKGFAPTPVNIVGNRIIYRNVQVNIDEDLLKDIANKTNGEYFRAKDEDELQAIYEQIDLLEKSKIEEIKFVNYNEHFYPWALAGLLLLAAEHLLKNTLFRSVI